MQEEKTRKDKAMRNETPLTSTATLLSMMQYIFCTMLLMCAKGVTPYTIWYRMQPRLQMSLGRPSFISGFFERRGVGRCEGPCDYCRGGGWSGME